MEYGFRVWVKFEDGKTSIFHNVTEIHYGYTDGGPRRFRVAFESSIHGTGATYSVVPGTPFCVAEFEVTPAKEIAWQF